MAALSASERERHAAARETWASAATARRELDEGLEFQLPATPELLTMLAEFIGFERRCCPFFTFELQVDGGPEMVFRMTGPAGTKAFLESL
jgi:hypothetical protein